MKKLLAVVLSASLALSMAACSSQTASNSSAASSSLTGDRDESAYKVSFISPIQAFPIGAMCAKALSRAHRSLA